MVNIEERIRSRFEWGLIADIQPPDLETKVAILMKKAELENIPLTDDVAMFIARRNRSNVRELEGALIRVGAFASLTGKTVTVEFAEEVLRGIMDDPAKLITVEHVQKKVARHFNVKISEMNSKTRARNLAFPRQIAMYLCRELIGSSFPELGKKFGGKDHATVIYACKKISRERESVPKLRKTLEILEQQIKY
jgi:chromosomal replication initiator protein